MSPARGGGGARSILLLFRVVQSTGGKRGVVGTVTGVEEVGAGSEGDRLPSLEVLDVGLAARGLQGGAGQAPGTMFRTGLVSPRIRCTRII